MIVKLARVVDRAAAAGRARRADRGRPNALARIAQLADCAVRVDRAVGKSAVRTRCRGNGGAWGGCGRSCVVARAGCRGRNTEFGTKATRNTRRSRTIMANLYGFFLNY